MPIRRSTTACTSPTVALTGDAKPILQSAARRIAGAQRQARRRARPKWRSARRHGASGLEKLAPQIAFLEAIRAELPEDGIFVDEVTQVGFAARLAFPVYKPRTFLSPGYQDQSRLGLCHRARRAARAARRAGRGDLRRRRLHVHRQRTGDRDAASHSAGHGRVQRRRLRQCAAHPAGALRQPPDRQRSRQSRLRRFRQKLRRRGRCARNSPEDLRRALRRAFAHRDGPTLIEVPVGAMPSPWEFIYMPQDSRPIDAVIALNGLATRVHLNHTLAAMALDSATPAAMQPITTTSELAAVCRRMAAPSFRHRRYRISARDDLLPAALRRADGLGRRGRGGRRAGAGHRSRAVLRADGGREGDEGVPRRAPGHRNRLARRQAHSASDFRHPGRGHGARLWRFHFLRPAGAAHHRRHARQIAPLHRLDAPAAVGGAARLRHFRRDPFARRLSRAGRGPQAARPRRLGARTR